MAEPHLIESPLLARHGVIGLFTLRSGGISPAPYNSFNFGSGIGDHEHNISRNIGLLLAETELDAPPHRIKQVHGTTSHWFSGFGHEHADEGDILLSDCPGTAVAVRTADCLPVLLADPGAGIVAAVHAGWRGTAAGAVCQAVAELIQHGARKERLLASLGPCIGPCCFEIGEDTAETLAHCCNDAHRLISHTPTPHADLRGINRLQLIQCGLDKQHIETIDACTMCDPERFFSWRRDQGATGRHLAVVALPDNP